MIRIILKKTLNRLPLGITRFLYRLKLKLWAMLYLPRYLVVSDTSITIPAWHWEVAIPCRIDTTRICYTGWRRDRAHMYYEPEEVSLFKNLLIGKKIFFDVGANIGTYSYLAAEGGGTANREF